MHGNRAPHRSLNQPRSLTQPAGNCRLRGQISDGCTSPGQTVPGSSDHARRRRCCECGATLRQIALNPVQRLRKDDLLLDYPLEQLPNSYIRRPRADSRQGHNPSDFHRYRGTARAQRATLPGLPTIRGRFIVRPRRYRQEFSVSRLRFGRNGAAIQGEGFRRFSYAHAAASPGPLRRGSVRIAA